MPLLSIIVPVYNKEQYIDDCITSILSQTCTDFELILVNDGSTDNSKEICKHYQQADSRVMLIDQHNQGVSAARNTGLRNAQGTYAGFIDCDDTIEPDMYEMLLKNALAANADIAACRLRVIFPDKLVMPKEQPGVVILSHEQALSACLKGGLDRSANNKIYKLSIARSIPFEGEIYEDILYTCKAFLKAKITAFENKVKYNYIVRDNSASMSVFNIRYMQTIAVSGQMVKLVAALTPGCIAAAQAFDVVANISLLNLLLLNNKNSYSAQYQQVVNTLKNYKSFINSSATISKRHRYAYRIFCLSPTLYTWLMHTYGILTGAEIIKRVKKI